VFSVEANGICSYRRVLKSWFGPEGETSWSV